MHFVFWTVIHKYTSQIHRFPTINSQWAYTVVKVVLIRSKRNFHEYVSKFGTINPVFAACIDDHLVFVHQLNGFSALKLEILVPFRRRWASPFSPFANK